MITSFYMPTRIVSGSGALATLGTLARDLTMSRVLVVSDPVISAQGFHADALAVPPRPASPSRASTNAGSTRAALHIDDQASGCGAIASTAWCASAAAR